MTEINLGGHPRVAVDNEQILALSKQGLSSRKIAEKLDISSATVVRRLQEINQNSEAKQQLRLHMLNTSLKGIELNQKQESLLQFMSRQDENYVEALAGLILAARTQGFKHTPED